MSHDQTLTAELSLNTQPSAAQIAYISSGMFSQFGAQLQAVVTDTHVDTEEDTYFTVRLSFGVPGLITQLLHEGQDVFPLTHFTNSLVQESGVDLVSWMNEVPLSSPVRLLGSSMWWWQSLPEHNDVLADASSRWGVAARGACLITRIGFTSLRAEPTDQQEVHFHVEALKAGGSTWTPDQAESGFQVIRRNLDEQSRHTRYAEVYGSLSTAQATARMMAGSYYGAELTPDYSNAALV